MFWARPKVRALPSWRMRRVQQLIDQSIGEPLFSSRLAGAAGLPPMHFAAQFRAATGFRPHEYLLVLLEKRVALAKVLMTTTESSLAHVALNVGLQGHRNPGGAPTRKIDPLRKRAEKQMPRKIDA